MGSAAGSLPSLRIVLCPWLAFGHMLPYLQLAERLALRGHQVSYVSTPRNLARLPPLGPTVAPHVNLVTLPFPVVDGLPDGAESTHDILKKDSDLLQKAFDGLAFPFGEFLMGECADEATRPHWIIADVFHHWAAASAAEHNVPFAMLAVTSAATVMAIFGWQPSEEERPQHTQERGAELYTKHSVSAMSILERIGLTKERCTVVAVRTCIEWEPEIFLLATHISKPVVPFGLLLPTPKDGDGRANREHTTVLWLDAQPPSSVVYVALGSEVPLSAEQAREMAVGLELAGTRFLWYLRKPAGATLVDDDLLPPGFLDRTNGKGLVTTEWCPQMDILSHAAVGGFLTHCGMNSVIEGLMFGLPLVMLPLLGDQWIGARHMEAKKVGLQVARNQIDGSFDRHGIATAVQAVMVEGESRSGFITNARKMQGILADMELQERYVDEFVQHLTSYPTTRATHGKVTNIMPLPPACEAAS